jgi:urease accessory protein
MSVIELLLADGRFPGGSFAHSGGLEAAVADASVHDVTTLEAFCRGRLHSAGPLEGWLAARGSEARSIAVRRARAAAAAPSQPSPALRAASRNQGRGLRRVAAVLWPDVDLGPIEVQPVVLGAVAGAAGLGPQGAARLAVSALVTTVVSAAPKLLALDMADAMAVAVRLAAETDAVARAACAATVAPIRSAPLTELRAEDHVTWEVRLFAS